MTMITVVLMAFFTLASSIKLIGWQKKVFETQLAFFKSYGLNRQIMFLVGIVEFSAVILFALGLIMTLPLSNALGAVVIALTSLGAIFFHLTLRYVFCGDTSIGDINALNGAALA